MPCSETREALGMLPFLFADDMHVWYIEYWGKEKLVKSEKLTTLHRFATSVIVSFGFAL